MFLRRMFIGLLTCLAGPYLSGCSEENASSPGLLSIEVELPADPDISLVRAREDLILAARDISGAVADTPANTKVVVRLVSDDSALGHEGYRLSGGVSGATIEANTAIGAMYGLYHIAGDIGARYIHPEQSVFPSNSEVTLPDYGEATNHRPHYALRGFHEHTQHPTVMSDYLLRADEDGFREGVSNYVRWLARNRQNRLTFHMLNTVNLDTWVPYMNDITAEAEEYGIEVGIVIGFVDQQQNAFRLVKPQETDPGTGMNVPAEVQITTKLDRFAESGIKVLGFQIGTSEFTKPDEMDMLGWLNLAVEHLSVNHSMIAPFAWIHTTCGLDRETGDGGPYYHLPLDADSRLGAFVHTTMFYDLAHPAPVYDCEDFSHQTDFLDAANGQRDLVYFPETAWWLGFDNNLPMVTPIAGRSRQYDIDTALAPYDVMGHVTFTTGREWTYWQYDHYLTQATWSGTTTWDEYLEWVSPVYGEDAASAAALIKAWTDRQWSDFYETHPELYFYIAGELPQDELGEAAGIIARPTKPSFKSIHDLDDEAFMSWQTGPFAALLEMNSAYTELIAELPEQPEPNLFGELAIAYRVSALRIQHTVALYEGTIAVRAMDQTVAAEKLAIARGITEEVRSLIAGMEALYRYPLSLLSEVKEASLTAYAYGYLYETSTAFFWTRRDEQLSALMEEVFNPPVEAWSTVVDFVYSGTSADLEIMLPESPLLGSLLGGFVPRILLGVSRGETDSISMTIGQDRNENTLPDPGSERVLSGIPTMDGWLAESDMYVVQVLDDGGMKVGDFQFIRPVFTALGSTLDTLSHLEIEASVSPENVQSIVAPFGIEPEALGEIIKGIWGIEPTESLPDLLPLKIRFALSA